MLLTADLKIIDPSTEHEREKERERLQAGEGVGEKQTP